MNFIKNIFGIGKAAELEKTIEKQREHIKILKRELRKALKENSKHGGGLAEMVEEYGIGKNNE